MPDPAPQAAAPDSVHERLEHAPDPAGGAAHGGEETVLVRLLDEGTTVYRPVQAARVAADAYRLRTPADYDPDDEAWEFPPGSTVVCEWRRVGGEAVWTAVAAAAD